MDLEQQIIKVLSGLRAADRPATFGDLSRRFGVSSQLIAGCAQSMVDRGLARPSMVDVRGRSTLHGLLPVTTAEPAS